jgi:peptidoglycan/LPS O-acetylase OafA/YrhL
LRIPSLDGLRAVSILLVILAHAQGTRGFPSWISPWIADHGALGVQIFFVISGFLITALVLEEHRTTGAIALGLFYARRTVRIFPPFYIFLLFLAVGLWMGWLRLPKYNLLFAATYTMNYVSSGVWWTGHIWSLSVEEQFYLIWPATIKLAGEKHAIAIAALLAVGSPLVCLAAYLLNQDFASSLLRVFPFIADSIASGCVLAGVILRLRSQEWFIKALSCRLGWIIVLVIPILDHFRNHPRLHLLVIETSLNLCLCYCIARYTEFPTIPGGRFLNNTVIASIGRVSYSLYLWQQPFMNPFGTTFLQVFPINIAAAFCCATLSYVCVEKPLAGLRKRLHSVPAVALVGVS